MRKTVTVIFVIFALALTLVGCSGAKTEAPAQTPPQETPAAPQPETQEPEEAPAVTYDLKEAGVSFDLPKQLRELKGVLQPGYGVEIAPGSGIFLSGLVYFAMPEEKFEELSKKGAALSEEETAYVSERIVDALVVYTIDGGRTLDDLAAALSVYGLPTEGCRLLGTAGEYNFFLLPDPLPDVVETEVRFDEGFREEFDAVIRACEDPAWIRVYEPEAASAGADTGTVFETADLDGNAVDSGELFRSHTLTAVNLWGTFCGPCIREMPELEALSHRLEEKNCAIVGVVIDADGANNSAIIASAKEIIADTGVTYLNLLPWDGINSVFPAQFVPTTYFVDSEGNVVGEPAVGARGADEYEALIDAVLETLEP